MTDEKPDPFNVSCPTCKARKRKPCVYQWPKDGEGNPRVRHPSHDADVVALMDRAGKPTKRPHTERYTKARLQMRADRRQAEQAEQLESYRERDAVLRANADALRDEQEQLVAWLRANVGILVA